MKNSLAGYSFMDKIMQLHMVMRLANNSFGKHTKPPLETQPYISNCLCSPPKRKFFYVTQPPDLSYSDISEESILVRLVCRLHTCFSNRTRPSKVPGPLFRVCTFCTQSCFEPQPLRWIIFFELRVPDLLTSTPCRVFFSCLHRIYKNFLMMLQLLCTTKML